MAAQSRHGVFSLGDLGAAENSIEVDLSTFHNAWLFFKTTQSGPTVVVEAAPEDFGETPNWFQYGRSVTCPAAQSIAVPLPAGVGTDYVIPARIRVRASAAINDVYVEGVRDVA